MAGESLPDLLAHGLARPDAKGLPTFAPVVSCSRTCEPGCQRHGSCDEPIALTVYGISDGDSSISRMCRRFIARSDPRRAAACVSPSVVMAGDAVRAAVTQRGDISRGAM